MATTYRVVWSGVQSGFVGIVLYLFLTPAFGEWVFISKGRMPTGTEVHTYIDASDVMRGRGQGGASGEVLYDFSKPQKIGSGPYFHSMATTYLVECSRQEIASIGTEYFSGPMGSAAVVDSDFLPPKFLPVESGSISEKILRSLCRPNHPSSPLALKSDSPKANKTATSGAALTHQWTRVEEAIYVDQRNQLIEGPRIRAWVRVGVERAVWAFAFLYEMNCANGTQRSLAHQEYRAGIPVPIKPTEDTPEEGFGEGRMRSIYYMLCEKVEKASGGTYITAKPRPPEATRPLAEPSESSDAWTLLTQDDSMRFFLDIGTLVPSHRELLGWLRTELSTDVKPMFTFQQFDCANNRMRAIGVKGEAEATRFASAGNWQTLADQGGDIVQSVCSRFDDLVQRAQSHKRALSVKEKILKGLKAANEGLPMFRHPAKFGDYTVVDWRGRTYGRFIGGLAYTVDDATGTKFNILYKLSDDSTQCRLRWWTDPETEAGAVKPAFSTNGLAEAKAAAKERCENFTGP